MLEHVSYRLPSTTFFVRLPKSNFQLKNSLKLEPNLTLFKQNIPNRHCFLSLWEKTLFLIFNNCFSKPKRKTKTKKKIEKKI